MLIVDEHVLDLLPAYALDCLDEDEAIQVAEHLAACSECQAELQVYQATLAQLALAAPDAAPPPALKELLMARIQPAQWPGVGSPQLPWRQSLAMLMRRTTPAWGVAGLVLIVALAVGNLWLWQRVNQLENRLLPSGVMQTIVLSGTQAAPTATGLIVISLDGTHGTLVVDRLPELAESHQYQLWLIKDGQRDSGGVFSVSNEGYGSLWLDSPQPLADYPAFGITIEPAGGSPGPTGEKILGGCM
ncbi:MAG: anti-sigma factor [Chloroflexota bacterium]